MSRPFALDPLFQSTKTVAGDYTFNVPNTLASDDPSASGSTSHVVRAKNGQDAINQMLAWIRSLPGYDAATKYNPQSWSAGPFKPVTQNTTTSGSRSAQLHAAIDVFVDQGYDRATAIRYARQIIGSKAGKRKRKPKPSNPGATSSQSR